MKKIIVSLILLSSMTTPVLALTAVDEAYMQGFSEGCRLMNLFYQGQAGNQTAEKLYLDGIAVINKRAAGNASELDKFGNQIDRKEFDFGPEKTKETVEASQKDADLRAWMDA